MSGTPAAVLRRASNEIPCPVEELSVHSLGAGGYRVEGCEVAITYTCITGACQPSERVSLGRRGRAGATWSDAQVRVALDQLRRPIGECLVEGTDTIRLEVGISMRGQLRRVGRSRLDRTAGVLARAGTAWERGARTGGPGVGEPMVDPALASCLDQALALVTLSGTVAESRFVVLDFRRGDPGPSPRTVESMPAPAAEGGAHAPEAAARAAIDARAPAILACVEAEALSLQVSWSPEGRLDGVLRGDRRGTPDEACVRALVQELSIPAPRSSGTIIHAIQR